MDAVQLELFSHRFAAVAGEMGELLRRTALSTNIKERMDFSCALLDGDGRLVVNAPHIPVHLGALGLCIRAVSTAVSLEPGDTVVTNHPAFGGSHLPDVTVATPVWADDSDPRPLAWVANRAHHAEIGGIQPGSVPARARRLVEEGVVIPPTHLVRRDGPRWEEIERTLSAGPHASRSVADNLADLHAALAANRRGVAGVLDLTHTHGVETVRHAMTALHRRAADLMRAALRRLPDETSRAVQRLDDGTPIAVRFTVEGDHATIDLSGSGGVHPGNLNATPAIATSAVLYVLRLLVARPMPLNEGLLEPVKLVVPHGLFDPGFDAEPDRCPAVVGGNVETSQRLVDTLLEALGLMAGSQGTMNNVIFGDRSFGFYETIGGGAGAGPGFDGAHAVHTHMTNTRLTDVEVMEHRFPVRVVRCSVRSGSGGRGRWSGGDGIVRELEFLAPVELSLLSQHRVERPLGMEGGEDGAPGRQWVVRRDGSIVTLDGIDTCHIEPGDRLVIETPGGGGWGPPP